MKMRSSLYIFIYLVFILHRTVSLPLSTRSRWIVDTASGARVKLHCVNWVGHMQPMLAEGLDKKPLQNITATISSLGFNCVRLTWATHLFTRTNYSNLTVADSLSSLSLHQAVSGVAAHNPALLNVTLVQAYDTVVDTLGTAGLMVVLDNHVSKPQWCCGERDGNGFFGDTFFDPGEWLQGLSDVASRYSNRSQVVGMSLRNELRGPRQDVSDWYGYISRGARKIHEANPGVLVVVSGLNYDTDLRFLEDRPLSLRGRKLGGKLVFEAHWYSFSGGDWEDGSVNRVCEAAVSRFEERVGFVAKGRRAVPLVVSEFGVDERGYNRADNRFLGCFLGFAAERDLDWCLWALQGSYYLRNGQPGFEETYGVLDVGWNGPRNPRFMERFGLVQQMMQDPRSSITTYQIIYHPLSGRCLWVDENNQVLASTCNNRTRWKYNGGISEIQLMDSLLCLKLIGDGLPVILSEECAGDQSLWGVVSSSHLQLAATDAGGRVQCLELDSINSSSNNSSVFTRDCMCLLDSICSQNPETQWFSFVPSNIP